MPEEVVLRLDRPTATSLADLIYIIGEHQAAGMPIAQLSSDDSERLGRVLHDLWRALGVSLPYGDVPEEEPRRRI
ncbi:hypothetical protein Q3W71_20420 [Micromonospora sp. C28SCA-DRY-2]|uniref:hypothetical protein n=1 Tax=Micromonospora sp. C28SCA-DRY-2 TaxID=3059522 RepID=UPI002675BB60|nr:hypothetical protein [Micromonospora sp. C28SCA-DRY-2]MDO3704035.1 hypothetical protein [Micromonospora sp. C28SCA-DRY-2]